MSLKPASPKAASVLPATAGVLRSQVSAALAAWSAESDESDPADLVMPVLEPLLGHIRECWRGDQVTVSRSDLSAILAAAWGMTGDAGAFNRLAEACGLVHP